MLVDWEVVVRTVCLLFLSLGSQDVGTSGPQLPPLTVPDKAPAPLLGLHSGTLLPIWTRSATHSEAQAQLWSPISIGADFSIAKGKGSVKGRELTFCRNPQLANGWKSTSQPSSMPPQQWTSMLKSAFSEKFED